MVFGESGLHGVFLLGGKTASGRAFELLVSSLYLPTHTFPNEQSWEFCSLDVVWVVGEMT